MKKIISGKMYDTDTARQIGIDGYGDGRDFSSWTETLYQKRTGEFFLHGEGGPMSRYSRSIGQNQWTGGEQIIPISYENARKWAEEHLDAENYEAVFGIPSEDGEDVQLHVSIPAQLMARLKNRAAKKGESITSYVVRTLGEAQK